MIEDFYFLDDGSVKITAASVGISRQRWVCINEEEINSKKHIDLMTNNKFDHLPILSENGLITEFFRTKEPNNFSKIERVKIHFDDIIPLDTNIREVIERFSEERRFYFLSYQKKISGLITIGNLNCKQVQVYIFSLICELERDLGNFINSNLSPQEIINWLLKKEKIDNEHCKYKRILEEFERLTELDLENQITEHFFLVDFFCIIKDFGLNAILEYSNSKWLELSSINELRNRIAHPTRSLLDNENTIERLKNRLKRAEELLFRLNTLCKSPRKLRQFKRL